MIENQRRKRTRPRWSVDHNLETNRFTLLDEAGAATIEASAKMGMDRTIMISCLAWTGRPGFTITKLR